MKKRPLKFRPDEGQSDVVGFVNQAYEASKESRTRLEQEWKIDYQYFKGRQDVRWSEKLNQFFAITPKTRRPDELVTNKIWTYVINNASDLGVEVPQLVVMPATSEPEDRQNARIIRKVFESLWSEKDLGDKVMDVVFIASIYGTGFLKVLWNNEAGRGGYDDEKGRSVHEGDFEISVLSPWEVYADPRADSVHEARFMIHCVPVAVKEIYDRYGVEVEADGQVGPSGEEELLIVDEFDVTAADELDEAFLDLMNKKKKGDRSLKGFALVKELWTPNEVITIANNKVLRKEENPLGLLPFIPFYDYREPKRFWGIGEPRMVRDLQKRLNKLNTQIVRNIELMGNPRILADSMTTFKTPVTNEFGQILRFEGPAPQIQPGVGIPGEMFEAADRVGRMMDEMSNQMTIDPVSLTKSNISGRFVEAYRDVANKALRYKKFKVEKSLKDLGRFLLSMMQLKFTSDRVYRTIGKNQDVQFWTVGKDMIQPGLDVYFTVQSNLPESKLGKQDFYLQMVQAGIMQPDEVRKLLGIEGVLTEVEAQVLGLDRDPDTVMRQAALENEQVARGESPEILPMRFEDAEAHVKLHYEFLNTYLKPNTREEQLMLDVIRKETAMMGNVQPTQSVPPEQRNPLGQGGPVPGQPPIPAPSEPPMPQTAQGMPAGMPPGMPMM